MPVSLAWKAARAALLTLLTATLIAGGGACSASKEPTRGELIIAFQTDLSVPKDIRSLVVSIYSEGQRIYFQEFPLAPDGRFYLPATLAVVEGKRPNVPVTLRVTGLDSARKARVIRQAISTVPKARLSLLHMPLQWLCLDKDIVESTDVDATRIFNDECTADGKTCLSGECKPAEVDPLTLPEYAGELVFGGVPFPGLSGGVCLDVLGCFAQGAEVVPDASCRVQLPSAAEDNVNIGLVLPPGGPGICGGQACIVALDRDDLVGWRLQDGRAQLPPAICERLGKDIQAVALTTHCAAKTTQTPICGPWTNIAGEFALDAAPPTALDGGTEAGEDLCRNESDGDYCEWDIGASGQRVLSCVGGMTQSATDCAPGTCNPGSGKAFCESSDASPDAGPDAEAGPPDPCAGQSDGFHCAIFFGGNLKDRLQCQNGKTINPGQTNCTDLCSQGACVQQTLGAACNSDTECAPLKCMTTKPAGFQLSSGAAPEGGVCTLPCSTTADECAQLPAGATCKDFGAGQLYCLQGCNPADTQKCAGRADMACGLTTHEFNKLSQFACLPVCSKDSLCGAAPDGGSYSCSFATRLCEQSAPSMPTFGADCSSAACSNSSCSSFKHSEGGTLQSCSASCHLGLLNACGAIVPTSSGAACLWPEDPANNQTGSAGRCMELCTCFGNPCSHPGYECQQFGSFIDSGVSAFLSGQGWDGYCGPDVDPFGIPTSSCPPG